jgi:NADPH2:quinone reductase
MNAAVVESFAKGPRFGSFADPAAKAGELLVAVEAAGLHPIVKALANGTHYGSTGKLPFVPGVDGVGRLEDGTRVYFGATRPPFGTFAERSVTNDALSVRLPDGLDSLTAAGIANPGMSSWVALTARAKFVSGESVLILGATGAAGQLAVQVAKRLGARRVVAAGRNPEALKTAKELGADAAISLEQERDALVAAFRAEITESGVDVVLDYLWGEPAEAVLAAIAQKGLSHAAPRIRFCADGAERGGDDHAAGGDAAQFRRGAAGQRIRKRIDGRDLQRTEDLLRASCRHAVCNEDQSSAAGRCGGAVECVRLRASCHSTLTPAVIVLTKRL